MLLPLTGLHFDLEQDRRLQKGSLQSTLQNHLTNAVPKVLLFS